MFELLLCAVLTILPDYLFRRYVQGKRFGKELTIYSVWYELRWGITLCVMLTVSLITVIFYNHPSTRNVTAFFRTVPILPESGGRIKEVKVGFSQDVKAGETIFVLDDSAQLAALATAVRRVEEIEAQTVLATAELAAADGMLVEAQGAYQQALDELATKSELQGRNSDVVSVREIERLQNLVNGRAGSVATALANKQIVEGKISSLLPAQLATAKASVDQAQIDLDKTIVAAGVDGRIEQFTLRPGDFVSPLMRPAGILIPSQGSSHRLFAGFNQIEGQVLKVGMTVEAACASKPFTIIPMVIVEIQGFIAAGQIRMSEQLTDAQQVQVPGTITAVLEPAFAGGLDGVLPGSSCIANAYTSNHDRLEQEDLGSLHRFSLHAIDTLALVHAALLRVQSALMPIQTLVLSGGH